MTFHEMMEQKTQACSQVLDSFLPDPGQISGSDRLAATVMDAMRYSTLAGGKRLRTGADRNWRSLSWRRWK